MNQIAMNQVFEEDVFVPSTARLDQPGNDVRNFDSRQLYSTGWILQEDGKIQGPIGDKGNRFGGVQD